MAPGSARAIRRQIFRFLHLSNDMYRNQNDASFSDAGGQVIYCFDATVFNLFLDPVKWRYSVSSFYSANWGWRGAHDRWKRIDAQSALIASEHLLSENLPGAKNKFIYLTPWHKLELAESLSALVRSLEERGWVDGNEPILKEIRRKISLLQAFKHRGHDEKPANVDGDSNELQKDLKELEPFLENEKARERYTLARRAAAVLVHCEESERLDQIHRLVSKPLRGRIRSLGDFFTPEVSEIEEIALDARQWFVRIARETENENSSKQRGPRRLEGIWKDARSIAFVRWAATKRARSDQRVVLVTSDDGIFDAYRRWWVGAGSYEAKGEEPFILRRSFQYTPIFNLSDSRNDISQSGAVRPEIQKLFSQIREAVEISLLPFNLSTMESEDKEISESSRMRGREYLALRARDYQVGQDDPVIDFFMETLDQTWYQKQEDALQDIAQLWREIERIGIGFFYDKIVRRLKDDYSLFGIDGESVPEKVIDERVVAYFAKSLNTLTQRTRSAWLPVADAFLSRQKKDDEEVPGRAPETLGYRFPDGRPLYEVIVDWNPVDAQFLKSAPEAAFVLASAFAIKQSEWGKADEFADYSVAACRDYAKTERAYWEVRFLSALTKRFRAGAMSLHLERSLEPNRVPAARLSFLRAAEIYTQANRMINECVAHFENVDRTDDNALALIRSKSERAALNLFHAASVFLTNRNWTNELEQEGIGKLLNLAQDDILSCIRLEATLGGRKNLHERKAVRQQYLHNGAASEVLRFLIAPNTSFEIDQRFGYVATKLSEEDFRPIERHNPLLRVEQMAFLIFARKLDPILWPDFERALTDGLKSELALDRAICLAVCDHREILFALLTR